MLVGNADLVSAGLTLEALTAKLFTALSIKDVDSVQGEINRDFVPDRSDGEKAFGRHFSIWVQTKSSQFWTRPKHHFRLYVLFFSPEKGSLPRSSTVIDMGEKADRTTEQLRQMVLGQAEKGKQSVTAARV